MLKKLMVLILAVICLLPSVCFADDAGPYLDKNENLSVSVDLKSTEAKIGGTLDFTVTMTNNTSYIVSYLHIYRVFNGSHLPDNVNGQFGYDADHELAPHETVVWDVSADINSQIDWYKNGVEFFVDFELIIEYIAFEYNDVFEKDQDEYFYYTTGVIPIKLTNLNDGSDLISFEEKENVEPLYFIEYMDEFDCGLEGSLSTKVYIYNNSKNTIENFNILGEKDGAVSDIINPGEFLTYNINNRYRTYIESTSSLNKSIKTVFRTGDNYYAAGYEHSYQIIPIHLPLLEFTISPNEEDTSYYDFVVKNTSNNDYIDLYLDLENSKNLSVQNFINLEKNHEYKETIKLNDLEEAAIKIGILQDNQIFYWTVSYLYNDDNKPEEILEILNSAPKGFIDGRFIQDLQEPTTTDRYAKPYETPTATLKPAPTVTASPTPAITVNSITKKPPVPYWVWIVLGAALVGTGIVLYVLGMRRSKKEID